MDIQIHGAREHNLQAVDVTFGDGLTVVTGVSGSGKTSLVFDTLYHEARRRFQEVFSLGATQRLAPAAVEAITGLGPAIAVGQNLLNRNPNSTLATASGLHPFLRLLYANFGVRHCPRCATPLSVLTEDEMVERLAALARRAPVTVCAPLVQRALGSHRSLLSLLAAEFGEAAVNVDGQPWNGRPLAPSEPHDVTVDVARTAGELSTPAAREMVRSVAALGAPAVVLRSAEESVTLARAAVCLACGIPFGDLKSVHFHTSCPRCAGEGCPDCHNTGLHPQAAGVRWQGLRLPDLLAHSVDEVRGHFAAADLPASAARLQAEIVRRLDALGSVGLGYVALDRTAPTLSRGEAQRVRLAVCLTSRLEDMLHVLDEPTIGLHPADVRRVLDAFRRLAGPVVYVEHDRIAAAAADRAVDLGPGAGSEGGRLLFSGTPAQLWQADTPTGRYFSLRAQVSIPARRPPPRQFLTLHGAHLRNLQGIDVPIPLKRLTVVTGVSGSGKSTLAEDVLVASLARGQPVGCAAITGPALKPVWVDQNPIGNNSRSNPATYTKLAGILRDHFAAATGLSPAHFSFNRPEGACPVCSGMGAVEIKMRYLPSVWIPCSECDGQRFSEAVLAQRIPCGDRQLSIAGVYALGIGEVRTWLATENTLVERKRRAALSILDALCDVGLGYLPLGQPSPTLSGGEAQRVKLARYLGRRSLSGQILVLDEPSTGLHPRDLAGLLAVLDRLVRAGATIVVVEHNADLIRAADWIVDLGPGAGPEGGRLLYAGPPDGLASVADSLTGRALAQEAAVVPRHAPAEIQGDRAGFISIRDARAHNLKGVDVDFPKRALTVVTGVSGSGKSSLVGDVLEAEARRRFLETLSLYERQSTREGPEAPAGAVTGLGVTVTVTPERSLYNRRASVGTATEISHHLAVLLAAVGARACLACGESMVRRDEWICPACGETAPSARPRHFLPSTYGAACRQCHGVGSLQTPAPEKLIVHPEKPLCGGAMYSPGFFPGGFLCKPFNSGYDLVQALAAHYDFDPAATPWQAMSSAAQDAFLFGTAEPLTVTYHSRTGRTRTRQDRFPGFYGWIRDWDVGGTYTHTTVCPACAGARLRPESLAVTLAGYNVHQLSEMPLAQLDGVLQTLDSPQLETHLGAGSLHTIRRRLRFLGQVGLGYLNLNRVAGTLSAGEAQRIKLAGLLGSQLTSFTVLLDEPSRGMHPTEVDALLAALCELRDEGNTVIVVEHDPRFMRAADHLIDVGPGAGVAGGRIVAQGKPAQVAQTHTITAQWLRGDRRPTAPVQRRPAAGWVVIHGARANNLRGEVVRLPLGVLAGVCGVSGSGKSTLLIDTLGRALAPRKQTTSVAHEPVEPGAHDAIEGAPSRIILLDQSRKGIHSPLHFLGLQRPLLRRYAESEDAVALDLDEPQLSARCSVCKGQGAIRLDMGFLPDVHVPCEACQSAGYAPEAWAVRVNGLALPELNTLTLAEIYEQFGDVPALARPLQAALDVGLGYLALQQPGHALSGGEAQRLKIARELCRATAPATLYILDEPTVGQHLEDVQRLIGVLHRLVDGGGSVVVSEHHVHLLAASDWLIELGPGGGPDGGRVVASGPPEAVAAGATATAAYLREVLR